MTVPPHDLGTERALLGAMLLDSDAIRVAVDLGARPEWFYSPGHGNIANAILTLQHAGCPVDPVTVAAELGPLLLDEVGGRAELLDLLDACPARTHASKYAADLARLALNRAWFALVAQLGQYTARGEIPPEPLLAELDQLRSGPTGTGSTSSPFVEWSAFWGRDWQASDWLLDPLIATGRATHIYARRGTGKSELMLACAVGLATGRNPLGRGRIDPVPVVYLDSEMGEADLFDRLVGLGHGVDTNLSQLHYAVLPSMPTLNTAAGGHRLLAGCREVGARLVVVDSLQSLVEGEENSNDVYDQLHQHTLGPLKREGIASVLDRQHRQGPDPGQPRREPQRRRDGRHLGAAPRRRPRREARQHQEADGVGARRGEPETARRRRHHQLPSGG
ncbi:MAG: DnaB-like helicase N-terminal domain-containing protein [Acidimicrobiales bacterium]